MCVKKKERALLAEMGGTGGEAHVDYGAMRTIHSRHKRCWGPTTIMLCFLRHSKGWVDKGEGVTIHICASWCAESVFFLLFCHHEVHAYVHMLQNMI